MTTHSLTLSPHEVRAALRGELGLIVRPVNGLGGTRPENKLAKCPLGVPGDRRRCRESYYIQDTHGQHRTDGLRWIITAHGLAEDAEATAIRGRRLDLAHGWRLIYRALGWMAAQYELDESWGPGLVLYDEIRRAANL